MMGQHKQHEQNNLLHKQLKQHEEHEQNEEHEPACSIHLQVDRIGVREGRVQAPAARAQKFRIVGVVVALDDGLRRDDSSINSTK